MTQLIKDQLVKTLDTQYLREKHHYSLTVNKRHAKGEPDSIISWTIQIHPVDRWIPKVDIIVGVVKEVYPTVAIYLFAGSEVYLTLI